MALQGRITTHMLAAHSMPAEQTRAVRFARTVRQDGEEIPAGFPMTLPKGIADELIGCGWCADAVTGEQHEPEAGVELEVDDLRQDMSAEQAGE